MSWQTEITADSMKAVLKWSGPGDDQTVDAEEVLTALRERSVPLDEKTAGQVGAAVEALKEQAGREPVVLLEGRTAKPGKNGYFEWAEACDPEKLKASLAEQEKLDRRSYYGVSSLIIVKQGDTLGKLHAPTEGEPGQDVLGRQISTQGGTEYKLEAGRNVEIQQDGCTFTAQCDGEPRMAGGKLEVDPILTIKGDVDFGTGNISYSGEVQISGDVKDLFTVRSGGDVTVGGTIEAAIIESGGSLTANRGIFGKEKGRLQVAQALTARYLSNVSAWVGGDVIVGSEIVNTHVNCSGKVVLEKGAIHGGQVTATGSIEAPVLGSPACVRTIIRAGLDPFAEQQLRELDDKHDQVSETLSSLVRRAQARLAARSGRPDKKLKEMAAQIKHYKQQLQELDGQRDAVRPQVYSSGEGTIVVHKMIHPGTVVCVGRGMEMVEHMIHGPLEITWPGEEAGPTLRFRSPSEQPA